MAAAAKDLQYKDALAQLQGIVRRVESSDVDVDELATSIRDANQLITICRAKLRTAEDEVGKALEDMRGDIKAGQEPACDEIDK